MEKHSVDIIRFGDPQSEKDHLLNDINSGVGYHMERSFPDTANGGSFYFTAKITARVIKLLNTYNGGNGGNRRFDIFIDDVKIASENLKGDKPGEYIEQAYIIPESCAKGKSSITIKFQGLPGNIAGAIFESRILAQ